MARKWNLEPEIVTLPDGTVEEDLPQKSDKYHVGVDTWCYGECARIVHEELYLSPPAAKVPKTVILYPVRRV